MAPKLLFAKYDVFNVLEGQKNRLKEAYLALSDNEALDEDAIQRLKAEYMHDVPVLKTAEMSYEENKTKIDARRLPDRIFFPGAGPDMEDAAELIIHIPFDGDPSVFNIAPSAYNSRIAQGEVVGQELLLRLIVVDSNYDTQGHIDREVQQINWALTYLREKHEYFSQELGAVLAQAVAKRKRAMESRLNIGGRLNIPQRQAVQPTLTSGALAQTAPVKPAPQKQSKKWDVFISHASEDKPYVEPLAKALEAAGVSVWYDRLVLEWGDDLRPMIDNGLVNCRYGIVVLSKAFLVRESKIIKFNVNTEVDGTMVPHGSPERGTYNLAPFQIVWRRPQELPFNWDSALLNFVSRREQRAFTTELLGRKLTCIVDGGHQVVRRGEVGSVLITFVDLHDGADLGSGHAYIESKLTIGCSQLSPSESKGEPASHCGD